MPLSIRCLWAQLYSCTGIPQKSLHLLSISWSLISLNGSGRWSVVSGQWSVAWDGKWWSTLLARQKAGEE